MKFDGGPAFPREDYQADDAGGQRGMSLRDYFAAHCPGDICDTRDQETAGLLIERSFPKNATVIEQAHWNVAVEAKMRYLYADAMLAARGKP